MHTTACEQNCVAAYTNIELLAIIAAWNNSGVKCFEAGYHAEAMARFRCALNLVTCPNMDDSQFPKLPESLLPSNDPLEPIWKARDFLQQDEATNQFVYAHPIEIDIRSGAYAMAPLTNHMILSAIIIWNMAVVFHFKSAESTPLSKDDEEKNTRRLQKAYSLYLNSISLVEQLLECGSYGNPVMDLFGQALLHNLWDCCKHLKYEPEAEEWNGRLLRYSVSVRRHYQDSPAVSEVLRTQAHQFAVNTIIGAHMSFLKVAAAA